MAELHFIYIISTLVLMATTCHAFDINDPKTNLDCFVRVAGSKNSSISTLTYFNGTAYHFQKGKPLTAITDYEGYNINRKVLQDNGDYLSLSLEFVVYRDPMTSEILQIWTNPFSGKPNEVFNVANNPVNGMLELGNIFPTMTFPNGDVAFNIDIVLEYPNALDPANYSKYSAGKVYDAVELFGYFSNLTLLETVPDISVGSSGTWMRKSQYLPWMEMGRADGSLYFTALVWTCPNGLGCVADDILDMVLKHYPEFTDAPKKFEEPNETSWGVFKASIDQRRKTGQPDILLPEVNIQTNLTNHETVVDNRILNLFNTAKVIKVYFNGSVYSERVGKNSLTLVNIEGYCNVSVIVPTADENYNVFVNIRGTYKDQETGAVLHSWHNPITGSTDSVPELSFGDIVEFRKNLVYSLDIPTRRGLGLIAAQSTEVIADDGDSSWSVNMVNVLFHNADIDNGPSSSFFSGTYSQFGSWFKWMDIKVEGNIVMKANFYRVFD